MILLSHFLDSETEYYAGEKAVIEKVSSERCGTCASSLNLKFNNHMGTHIDLPSHFSKTGKVLNDYSLFSDWCFDKVTLVDINCEESHLISPFDLENALKKAMETECLLIRTSFEKYRGTTKYWSKNPGVSAETAIWLKSHFKNLKVIGFDFISLTSYENRDEGRRAHYELLSGENPIRIIEDMKLSILNGDIQKILISPLLINNADGTPVTVWAEV